MKFFVTWFYLAFASYSLASDVEVLREEKQRTFEDTLGGLIVNRNYERLASFLSENASVKYTHFGFMENILSNRLETGDYEIASILLDSGIRLSDDICEILIKLIIDGEETVLRKVLDYEAVHVSLFCDYDDLVMKAVETGNFSIFKLLISKENLISQCSNKMFGEAAKIALEQGYRGILENDIKIFNKNIKKY